MRFFAGFCHFFAGFYSRILKVFFRFLELCFSNYFFVGSVYSLEASLKMFGLGMDRYFASGWNTFDFLITSTSVIGLFVEVFGQRHFLVIARHLR